MTHPVEHLAEYVDGTLPAGARAEVDTHLDSCPECRADVELAGRARSVLRDAPEVEVPFGTVRPGTGRGGRSRERDRFRRTAWAGGFAAAASIAAILTLVVLSGGRSVRPAGRSRRRRS
jgi:anti-sigma factor RsiW